MGTGPRAWGRVDGAGAGGGRWKVEGVGTGIALGGGRAERVLAGIEGGACHPVALKARLAARLASNRRAASYHAAGS